MIAPPRRSERDGVLAVARFLPLLIAAFELRFALVRAVHVASELRRTEHAYLHSLMPWIVTLLAVGAVFTLREVARGLTRHLPPPRRSIRLMGVWLGCSALFAAVLGGQELARALIAAGPAGHSTALSGAAGWSSLPVAVLIGFALAASLQLARWVVHEVRTVRRRAWTRRRAVLAVRGVAVVRRPLPAPLLAGWSDRGPPVWTACVTA